MVLALAGLILVLVAGYALVLAPAIREALFGQQASQLEVHAELVAAHVELGVENAFLELERLAAHPRVRSMRPEDLDVALGLADARTSAFLFFFALDAQGRYVARPSKPSRVGADRSSAPFFIAVRDGAARYASGVTRSPSGNLSISFSVPIRDDAERFVGVLVGALGAMDRNPRLYRFVTNPPAIPGYQLALADAGGQVIAVRGGRPGQRVHVDPVLLSGRPDRQRAPGGQPWLVCGKRVAGAPWWVIARVPESQLAAELHAATGRFAALVLPFLGAVFVVSVIVARRMARRLEALTGALTRYGREGWAEPVPAGGRDEVAAAGHAFNRMLEDRDRAHGERARLEERLRQAARMETVGRFASGVAHDMNNLLTPILSYAELLQAATDPASPAHEWAAEVVRVSGRARDLLQQVLAYGRAAAPRREPVDLGALVDDGVRTFQGGAPSGLVVRQDLAPGVQVLGDPTQLQQVLLNLLTNAAQATGQDGRIDVRLSIDAEGARLGVHDTGAGMDEATLARVFEPFFTTRPHGKGTGLGLAIVQGIVAAHGGHVRVTSAPGEGTTFEVLLPLHAPDQGAA